MFPHTHPVRISTTFITDINIYLLYQPFYFKVILKTIFFQEHKLSEDEKKCVDELKKLYLDTIKLDVELQREIYNLEKSYEKQHNEIYDKRVKLLE